MNDTCLLFDEYFSCYAFFLHKTLAINFSNQMIQCIGEFLGKKPLRWWVLFYLNKDLWLLIENFLTGKKPACLLYIYIYSVDLMKNSTTYNLLTRTLKTDYFLQIFTLKLDFIDTQLILLRFISNSKHINIIPRYRWVITALLLKIFSTLRHKKLFVAYFGQ